MDLIFLGLLMLVVCTGAGATAALLYAISLRAKIEELEAEVVVLELERADREGEKPDPYHLLEVEWNRLKSRWHRRGEPFALALVDLGDALRPQVDLPPAVMAKSLAAIDEARRTEDCAFQLDGRTAAVLLAGSSTDGGWAFVDRLRRVLGNEPVTHEGGAAYVDARVGIAEWTIKLTELGELIDAAYRARKDFSGQIFEQRGDFLPGGRGAAVD
ncbi:MAG: hypothetical protein ABIQ47_05355 [Tepidiformaceae bacterium]